MPCHVICLMLSIYFIKKEGIVKIPRSFLVLFYNRKSPKISRVCSCINIKQQSSATALKRRSIGYLPVKRYIGIGEVSGPGHGTMNVPATCTCLYTAVDESMKKNKNLYECSYISAHLSLYHTLHKGAHTCPHT